MHKQVFPWVALRQRLCNPGTFASGWLTLVCSFMSHQTADGPRLKLYHALDWVFIPMLPAVSYWYLRLALLFKQGKLVTLTCLITIYATIPHPCLLCTSAAQTWTNHDATMLQATLRTTLAGTAAGVDQQFREASSLLSQVQSWGYGTLFYGVQRHEHGVIWWWTFHHQ